MRIPGFRAVAAAALLATACAAPPAQSGVEPAASSPPVRIDCAGNPAALKDAPAIVQYEEGGELHQYWLLEDRADLWQPSTLEHDALTRFRKQVREISPDTSPLAVIRQNREMFPWLELEHPAERTINRLVESGAGRHRPLSCLESRLLGFQAARFPLFDRPTEIAALVLRRATNGTAQIKIYVLADDDGPPPKPTHALPAMAADLEHGWRLWGTFHNHTVNLDSERGHLAIPAPSASDLEVFRFLHSDFGLEHALVTDGFTTHELTAEEFLALAAAVDEAVEAEAATAQPEPDAGPPG